MAILAPISASKFSGLAQARLLVVHIEGAERRSILTQAVADGKLPIARVLAKAATAPQIYWAA